VAEFCRHYALTFRDPGLVKLALTHRSYLHVTGQRDSNERLEFLGDSVLGLVTSENLYRAHPTEHEGQLTKTKSLLVSKAILSRRALAMGLGRFVLMSHSEVESGGRQRLSILADAFESVVGAVYLDQGFEAARAFIERWLLADTRAIVADKRHTNYKSHLQEYVQSTYRTHPVYRIRHEMGPDHSKQFMVEVIVGKRTLGEGKGRNKKEAEQAAARNALERVERGPVSDRGLRDDGRGGDRPAPERPARSERPPRGERPPRTAAPVIEPDEEDEEETSVTLPGPGSEDREVLSTRRRRRGRRGGRGRRRPGEGAEEAEGSESRPIQKEPAPSPERSEARVPLVPKAVFSRPRPVVKETVEAEPPRELEPRPRRFEEEDDEEAFRPEGPREEAHVDPYAWGGPELRRSPQVSDAPAVEEEEMDEPEQDETPEVESQDDAHDAESRLEEVDEGWSRPESSVEPPSAGPVDRPVTPPAPPAYGRRGRPRR
jgi:ribonuclease III